MTLKQFRATKIAAMEAYALKVHAENRALYASVVTSGARAMGGTL